MSCFFFNLYVSKFCFVVFGKVRSMIVFFFVADIITSFLQDSQIILVVVLIFGLILLVAVKFSVQLDLFVLQLLTSFLVLEGNNGFDIFILKISSGKLIFYLLLQTFLQDRCSTAEKSE